MPLFGNTSRSWFGCIGAKCDFVFKFWFSMLLRFQNLQRGTHKNLLRNNGITWIFFEHTFLERKDQATFSNLERLHNMKTKKFIWLRNWRNKVLVFGNSSIYCMVWINLCQLEREKHESRKHVSRNMQGLRYEQNFWRTGNYRSSLRSISQEGQQNPVTPCSYC